MPYMLQPKNYVQTARPNLYNVAYRRVGGYKGMGRLHPTNYLEIGARPVRFGATTGQYNTLSTQLSLLPPSLRGLGWFQRRRGLGQVDVVTPQAPGVIGTPTLSASDPAWPIIAQMQASSAAAIAAGATAPDVGTGTGLTASDIAAINATNLGISNTTLLYIAGGVVLLLLLMDRRR